MAHLESNLNALDLKLNAAQIAYLDASSKPVLNFPAEFNASISPGFAHAGATVNGVPSNLVMDLPKDDASRW